MTLAERVECLEEQCEAHRRAISTLREERPGRRVLAAFGARAKAEREAPVAAILDELDLA